eukprot:7757619-Pyramimonas_sp.AAC.1
MRHSYLKLARVILTYEALLPEEALVDRGLGAPDGHHGVEVGLLEVAHADGARQAVTVRLLKALPRRAAGRGTSITNMFKQKLLL